LLRYQQPNDCSTRFAAEKRSNLKKNRLAKVRSFQVFSFRHFSFRQFLVLDKPAAWLYGGMAA
jgi:hypothetical protein